MRRDRGANNTDRATRSTTLTCVSGARTTTARVLVVCAIATVSLLALALSTAAPARGAGTLDFDPPGAPSLGSFTAVVLNGSPQLTSAALSPFSVTDSTGSGAGWNLVFRMSQLTNGSHTLPTGSVTMAAPTITAGSGNTATPPAVQDCSGSSALDTAQGCAVAIADPATGDHLGSPGTWLFSPRAAVLTVPGDAFAGAYTTTFTVSLTTGP
jgi:hypothetical protein